MGTPLTDKIRKVVFDSFPNYKSNLSFLPFPAFEPFPANQTFRLSSSYSKVVKAGKGDEVIGTRIALVPGVLESARGRSAKVDVSVSMLKLPPHADWIVVHNFKCINT